LHPYGQFRGQLEVLALARIHPEIANLEIAEDEVRVSFDVVSLFTAIPVDKACDYIRKS